MFEYVRRSDHVHDGVEVDVDVLSGEPSRFWCKGDRLRRVTAVHGRWREWSVAGTDTECWRVESGSGLVVVLVLDLETGRWHLGEVWD